MVVGHADDMSCPSVGAALYSNGSDAGHICFFQNTGVCTFVFPIDPQDFP